MVVFPPCKINLGLHVIARRDDGYHQIETCFYTVPWTDVLEIIPSEQKIFTYSGLPIPGNEESNLCVRAYELLKQNFSLPEIQLHLHKIIPMGAGLGGGSSDAAYVLRLLNQIFELYVSEHHMALLASQLGSDCSYFLKDAPQLGTGRGEHLSEVNLSLAGKFMVIVYPGIAVSTKDAYRAITPQPRDVKLKSIVEGPASEWKKKLVNDFELPVFAQHPLLPDIKEKLYRAGAFYSAMSGSGSSLFALFDQAVAVGKDFPGMLTWSGWLS